MAVCQMCGEEFKDETFSKDICQICTRANMAGLTRDEYLVKSEFSWWRIYGFFILIVWNLFAILGAKEVLVVEAKIAVVISNTILGVLILKHNKYAFLIATILSGPLFWIINGIYLKNRWNHPLLNSKKSHDSKQNINLHEKSNDKY